MKKYILYTLLILVSSSCSKEFTELSPISERNIQSAYKTEADFAVAVNGLYDALQLNGTYGKTYLLLNEIYCLNPTFPHLLQILVVWAGFLSLIV